MKTHWSIRVTTNREARVDRLIRALRVSGVTHLFDVLLYEKEQELKRRMPMVGVPDADTDFDSLWERTSTPSSRGKPGTENYNS